MFPYRAHNDTLIDISTAINRQSLLRRKLHKKWLQNPARLKAPIQSRRYARVQADSEIGT